MFPRHCGILGVITYVGGMQMETRVYDALAALRNLSDEFASFEVQADDRKKKKLYTDCRKHIGKVVDELESHLLRNHGEQSGQIGRASCRGRV